MHTRIPTHTYTYTHQQGVLYRDAGRPSSRCRNRAGAEVPQMPPGHRHVAHAKLLHASGWFHVIERFLSVMLGKFTCLRMCMCM